MSVYRGAWLMVAAALILTGMLAAAAMSLPNLLVLFTAFALVVVASSPWVVGASRRWLHTVPSPLDWQLDSVVWALSYSGPAFVPFQPPPGVQPVSDDQLLCRAWSASYRELEDTTSRRKAMRIVEERGGYLDELERRNPAALAAWLASAATAADGSMTYLSEARGDPSAIDWDELLDGQDDR